MRYSISEPRSFFYVVTDTHWDVVKGTFASRIEAEEKVEELETGFTRRERINMLPNDLRRRVIHEGLSLNVAEDIRRRS